ncbi:MAG: cadherin-like beta sandwich domain-containing protein [Syntrophobacterales bacterium]|jgi:hypothetical protein|nr:cadherin-like beta sandwich domain-containing protein [Syntrophobacterales bacterium]
MRPKKNILLSVLVSAAFILTIIYSSSFFINVAYSADQYRITGQFFDRGSMEEDVRPITFPQGKTPSIGVFKGGMPVNTHVTVTPDGKFEFYLSKEWVDAFVGNENDYYMYMPFLDLAIFSQYADYNTSNNGRPVSISEIRAGAPLPILGRFGGIIQGKFSLPTDVVFPDPGLHGYIALRELKSNDYDNESWYSLNNNQGYFQYSLTVPPGQYKIAFGYGRYGSANTFQYFNGKTTDESADIITVTAFEDVTGVNTVGTQLSSDATLASLTVSAGTLIPAFTPNTTNYTVTVPNNVSSINITAAATHGAASVAGTGTKDLVVGINAFSITVTAENGATHTYTIAVTREGEPPEITTSSLPSGTAGTQYNEKLEATGDPDRWSIVGGALPEGLILTANGIISGIPRKGETASFTIRAENQYGFDEKQLFIETTDEPPIIVGIPPIITTTFPNNRLPDAVEGELYPGVRLTATGTAPIYWSASGLPEEMWIDAQEGIITGIPRTPGMKIFSITATNIFGPSVDTKTYQLYVRPAVLNTDAQFLQESVSGILRNGLSQSNLSLNGKVLTLVIDGREFVLSSNANNRNISGEIALGNGYYLVFDIKGNGSNVKDFRVIKR